MNREKISEALTNISSRYIEEAAEAELSDQHKFVWIKWSALAACICLVVVATAVMLPFIKRDENIHVNVGNDETEAQPIEKEPVKYVMYADYAASAGENSSIDAERSDIEMKPTAEKNFNIIKREYVNDPVVDSTNIKKFKILNETYDVSYVRSYNTTLVSSGNSGAFHMYYSSSDSIIIEARDGTNEIVYFSNSRVSRREDGNFSIEQAEAKAKQVVESLYGRESLEDYSFEIELIESNNNEKYYSAQYNRYVYGFKTEDNITVKLNMNGELAAVVSLRRGIMSTAEQDLTKEEIENAIKAVNENFSSSWNISSDHYIVIDSNGDYYLRSTLARNRDKFPFAMQIFTNIQ